MDTMTTTKVTASLCGALLVLLLGKWAATAIYTPDTHGGEQSYVIDTGATGGGEAAEEVDFATLYAEADIEKGARVFRKCSACHKLEDGANGTGPYLTGLVGRPVASANGYAYSTSLAEAGGDWTPERLDEFLANPKAFASNTKMSVNFKKQDDRVNVIAYLESLQ